MRILKSSISTLEAFNRVRNERSLAHDNPMLGYDESLFIFNHICNAVRFIRVHESRGFNRAEINRLKELVERNQFRLLEAWHEFYGE